MPWCSCATSRQRSTGSSRSRPRCSTALSGPGGSIWSTQVPRVGSALAARERPLVLVLDDLHAVANPSCLDVVSALPEYVPAGSQIAIASREAPALPLARWRAHGRVQEIGVTDLRLDEQEAELLLQAAGVELDATDLSALIERTEGWPAGLYLAALAVQAGAPSAASAARFTGEDRFVAGVLPRGAAVPAARGRGGVPQAHLRAGSDVRPALRCGARRRRGRRDTLETLARTNGFVVPLDRRGEWYRYHHLFGELLRDELERSEPDVMRALNRRAMAWCIENDLRRVGGRLRARGGRDGHRRRPGRCACAAAVLRRPDGDLWRSGWRGSARTSCGATPRWRSPAHGSACSPARPAEAERWLALADGATSTIPLADGSATIEPWVATLRAHMMPDGVEQALADADLALDQLPPDSIWRSTAHLVRGVAHALLGATDRATDELAATDRERAGGRRGRGGLRGRGAARAARGQAGRMGRGGTMRAPGARDRRRGRPRRLQLECDRATPRRRVSRSMRRDRSTPARRWHARTACGRCSTTASPG